MKGLMQKKHKQFVQKKNTFHTIVQKLNHWWGSHDVAMCQGKLTSGMNK
jgi:hypothetical protein